MTTLTAENQYVCHDLLVSSKSAEKITYFAQSKRNPPEHNLHVPTREKNSLEQAASWHDVKVVCCVLTPFSHAKFITLQCTLGSNR